jgi:hypothetical protein
MSSLRAFFDERRHYPSADHWLALEDIARTLEDMADGRGEPLVYLSAIDPGVGKSSTVAHFARALVASTAHRECGMVICVGRIAEARTIATDLGIPRDQIAVLTSDAEANALGIAQPGQAQILVTTQQRIEMACDGRSFACVSAFHYQGRPRAIRAWDEAWLPGVAVTLDRDNLLALVKPVRGVSSALADALEDFAIEIRHIEDGAMVNVPDVVAVSGASPWEVLASAAGITGRFRDDLQMAATALVTMSGRAARVRRDGPRGAAVLTFRETLPADLAPLIVLDASGRVRETYRDVERHRGTLRRLRAAAKDYGPLTVNVWPTSGSKSGWDRNADKLLAGVAAAIETKPHEEWLVVLHKAGGRVADLAKALNRRLDPETAARVRTLTWGQHVATNAHAEVPNVILAGTLFMPTSFYTALTHLAQDRDVVPGLASGEEIARTTRGEHANLVLQALCRGRVRKSNGAQCLPMEAWVIASPRSGIPADLEGIFPGCNVRPWKPDADKPQLTGKPLRALEAVQAELEAGAKWISFRSIADRVSIDLKDFKKRIAANDDWMSAVGALGMVEGSGHRGARGLRKEGVGVA